jgi:ferric iron reductase protein FhuF
MRIRAGTTPGADTTSIEEAALATATLRKIVDELTSAVDYLRVTIDAPFTTWLACDRLVRDAGHLAAVVGGTKAERGTDRDDVAMSLFVQGYVFRIATVAVGAWLTADAVIDVAPATTAIAVGRGRPNAVDLAAVTAVVAPAGVEDLHASLVEGHLAPMLDTAHAACRVGAALLWGNAAASCAAAFSAFAGAPALADRRADIADRVTAFFAAARPELRDAGTVVRVGARFAWERRSCCLWYQTDGGYLCEDCSLRPADEHRARYAAMADDRPPTATGGH